MRQEQYRVKYESCNSIKSGHPIHQHNPHIDLYDDIYIDADGNPHNRGPVDIFNVEHMRKIIQNFAELKMYAEKDQDSDIWGLVKDIEELAEETLKSNEIFYDIFILRGMGFTNQQVKDCIREKYDKDYSIERISTIWFNRIPQILSEKAQEDYLIYHYTFIEKGQWKKCGCCGEVKLAHHKFFSTNTSSKDGWYSICKECRSKKNRMKKEEKKNGG